MCGVNKSATKPVCKNRMNFDMILYGANALLRTALISNTIVLGRKLIVYTFFGSNLPYNYKFNNIKQHIRENNNKNIIYLHITNIWIKKMAFNNKKKCIVVGGSVLFYFNLNIIIFILSQ